LVELSIAGEARPQGQRKEGFLLSERAVAKVCGVHVETVGRWRRLGIGPPCQRRGRRVIYDQAAVVMSQEVGRV
jgi:hypothetical protein